MTEGAVAHRAEPSLSELSLRTRLAPLATGPILLIAGAVTAVLVVAGAWYGYFGEELYFMAAGHHLAWGYADQQPAIPLLARAMQAVFGDSPLGLRVPAILVSAAGVLVTGLLARELGGGRNAQTLAAGTYALCPQILINGRLMATVTFDPFLWTVVTWLLVRWVRRHLEGVDADRLLLWAGVVTAVAIQVKFLILGFWLVAGIALLLVGPRSLLCRPLLWVGAGIVVVTTIPTLGWQARHGWPQLGMGSVVRDESPAAGVMFPLLALIIAGTIGAVLLCYGVFALMRKPRLRPYRFLGFTLLGLAGIFTVVSAREYYLLGMYPVAWAVAAVEFRPRWSAVPLLRKLAARGRKRLGRAVFAFSAVLSLSTLTPMPLLWSPLGTLTSRVSTGWPELAGKVARTLHSLPPEKQASTAIVTGDYWSAGALRHYGPGHGIHDAYSGNRGYWYFGRPPSATQRILYLGGTRSMLRERFDHVQLVSTVDTGGIFDGTKSLWLAEGPRASWPQLWSQFRTMRMWN